MGNAAFQRGQFRSFRATCKIHLGKYETDILSDDTFDYDGYTIRYSGMEYGIPQLRGTLGDWFVPVADQTTRYKSKPAGVQVSHATPEARDRGDTFTMDEASEEEAVVGTMTEQKAIRKAASEGNTSRLAELRAVRAQRKRDMGIGNYESNPDAPPPENFADVDIEVEAALMDHAQQTFVQAVPVHQARASNTEQISSHEQAVVAEATARNLEAIRRHRAELEARDPGKSREEMGGNLQTTASEGRRAVGKGGKYTLVQEDAGGVPVGKSYKFSGGATVGAEVVEAGAVAAVNVTKVAGNQPVQVGRAVASTPKRGKTGAQVIADPATLYEPQAARAAQTTQIPREGNVGIDEIREGGATGDVDVAMVGDDLATLLPGAAVAGQVGTPRKKAPPAPVLTETAEIAEVLQDWNMRRHWRKRVQEAVDFYGDWPEVLDAICKVESPKVAEQIRARLKASAQS